MRNTVSGYLVTSNTDALDNATDVAVANWNNGLRNYSPTNLTKYPLHKNPGYDDPAANVRVYGYYGTDFDSRCSPGGHGCVQDELNPDWDNSVNFYAPTLYIIINLTAVTTEEHKRGDIAHEMGHLFFLNEHYTSISGPCNSGYSATYYSVMDLWECDALQGPASHDRQDFFDAYKPQDASNPSTMSIASGGASVTLGWSNAGQHNISKYYYSRHTDTDGSLVDEGYTSDKYQVSKTYTVADGNRYCAKANGVSEAGFQGLNPFAPSTYYGCWTRVVGNAGRLVATSHRGYGSEIRVKNMSGAQRDVTVTGPNLQYIGCNWASVPSNGTYFCTATVSIRQYSSLLVIMQTGSSQTLAALDFD